MVAEVEVNQDTGSVIVCRCVLALINRSDVEASDAGEISVTLTAAAIGNAIFDATGARFREIPFTPEGLKRALESRV
jgi:CO/xanthine dehydrogenase Mo-binding subunit